MSLERTWCVREEIVRKSIFIWPSLLAVLTLGIGCATHSRTVTTESARYSSSTVPPSDNVAPGSSSPTESESETRSKTETESSGESTGLLSGTVHVVGQALALPFRFVGGLIGAIF